MVFEVHWFHTAFLLDAVSDFSQALKFGVPLLSA